MTDHIEVKIENGRARARRRDGLPLTDDDRVVARRLADELRAKQPGVTVADVLRIFPGARVIEQPIAQPKPLTCTHCNTSSTPEWRKGGRVAQAVTADEVRYWMCALCGRRLSKEAKKSIPKPKRKPQ